MSNLTLAATLLQAARARYAAAHPRSKLAFDEAVGVLPGGGTRSSIFVDPFPLHVASGTDDTITDLDGHVYLDMIADFTSGLYGKSHPVLKKAISEALDDGLQLGMHTPHEARLARLLTARFPSMDLVRFANSGTEANLLAIAAAQRFTRRRKVLVFEGGYHGSLLCGFSRKEAAPGADPFAAPLLRAPFEFLIAPYNDAAGTRALALSEGGADLACIIAEPMLGAGGCIPGDPDFLRSLRALADETGALLILDEVQTARLSVGGRQALLGIEPDLTTVGKFFGGGFAFGAFGGTERVISMFDSRLPGAVSHGGTFNNSPLTMRAGAAAAEHLLTAPTLAAVNALGDGLRDRANALFDRLAAPLEITGLGSINQLKAKHGAGAPAEVGDLVFFGLLERGIAIAQRGLISLTLNTTEADVARFVAALEDVVLGLQPCWASLAAGASTE